MTTTTQVTVVKELLDTTAARLFLTAPVGRFSAIEREIRDVHHVRVPKESMRTAAFIIAIKKVALTYEQLGIFP